MTNIVQEFRKIKQGTERNTHNQSPNMIARQIISRYFKSNQIKKQKGRKLTSTTASTVKRGNSRNTSTKQFASSLKCIPETKTNLIAVNKNSKRYSDLNIFKKICGNSQMGRQELVESLLHRNHSIFSKTTNSNCEGRDLADHLKTEWYNIQERGDEDSISDENSCHREIERKDSLPIKLSKQQIYLKPNIKSINSKCMTARQSKINPNYQMKRRLSADTDSSENSRVVSTGNVVHEYCVESANPQPIFRPDLLEIPRFCSPSVNNMYLTHKSSTNLRKDNYKSKAEIDFNIIKQLSKPISKSKRMMIKRNSIVPNKTCRYVMNFV